MEIKAIYNQRDPRWAGHIYSAVPPHTETVKSSGCGVTSAAMIISNLTNEVVTPDVMADYSVTNGFRIDGTGTAFALFPAIAEKYGLNCVQASDINKAMDCVANGGMVVCSTNGSPTGLFSTGGHLFIMSGANGDTLEFVDPDLYPGKYDVSYRKYKANVSGGRVYVKRDVAKLHISKYFLFNKGADEMPKITIVGEGKNVKVLVDGNEIDASGIIEKNGTTVCLNFADTLRAIGLEVEWKAE